MKIVMTQDLSDHLTPDGVIKSGSTLSVLSEGRGFTVTTKPVCSEDKVKLLVSGRGLDERNAPIGVYEVMESFEDHNGHMIEAGSILSGSSYHGVVSLNIPLIERNYEVVNEQEN